MKDRSFDALRLHEHRRGSCKASKALEPGFHCGICTKVHCQSGTSFADHLAGKGHVKAYCKSLVSASGSASSPRRPVDTVHLFVSGRVQGVGFRDAFLAMAQGNDFRGGVRNCSDGRVEALVQPVSAVSTVKKWLSSSRFADDTSVTTTSVKCASSFSGFTRQ
jgi:acylphosphatase